MRAEFCFQVSCFPLLDLFAGVFIQRRCEYSVLQQLSDLWKSDFVKNIDKNILEMFFRENFSSDSKNI